MGNQAGKHETGGEKPSKNVTPNDEEVTKQQNPGNPVAEPSDEVFADADVNQNNGTSSQKPAVTDSMGTADPKNAWNNANTADQANRPHLARLFSRDAPGREDNTFKDRPSESDELQTIQEDSGVSSEGSDLMEKQKLSSQGQGTKQMATASTADQGRQAGANPRQRDSGLLDHLGKFFGGEKEGTRKAHEKGKVSSKE
nr:PREDICTED: myelin basic protein [Latimeria chalumnae]|eukprot:XP_014347163.1 PREDICTED: myelin basic protein [Latimeria chalumnae]